MVQGKLRVPEVVEYVKDGKREYVVLTEIPGVNCVEAKETLDDCQIVTLLRQA